MTDRPVSGVAVTLEAADGARLDHVFTTEAGHFLLSARRPGALRLRASRIGYEDVVTPPYRVAAGDSVQVILRLNVKAALMPPLEVLVHRRAEDPRLAEFVYRKERGMGGIFIDREDPALPAASRIADAIRGSAPGVRVGYDQVTRRTNVAMARAGSRFRGRGQAVEGCSPAIFLDGMRWQGGPGERSPLDFLSAQDIEGIEIYRGPSETPAAFSGSGSGCGVIALWTRRAH